MDCYSIIRMLQGRHFSGLSTKRKKLVYPRLPETKAEMAERKRHIEKHCEKRH